MFSNTLNLQTSKASVPQHHCKFCKSVFGEAGCPDFDDLMDLSKKAEEYVKNEGGASSSILSAVHQRPLNPLSSSNYNTFTGIINTQMIDGNSPAAITP